MKKLFGRIVHYHFDESLPDANSSRTAPAIVVSQSSEDRVNLKVFLDGESNLWATSVKVTAKDTGKPNTCFLPTIKK